MKILKALLGAAFYIVLFVYWPRLTLTNVPSDILGPLGPVENILMTSTVVGIVLALLFVIKTLTAKQNPLNLVVLVVSELVGFYVFLFFISFGNPINFGRVEKAIPIGPGVTVKFDFRIFVQLTLVVLVFRVAVGILEFYNVRCKSATGNITK